MKKIGKIILTIVASLLVLAVPVAFVWGMLNLKGQDTITLDEARAFVTTVCNAMVHDDSGELSTASTDSAGYYPYNYVRLLDCGGTSYLQALYMIKFALDDGEGNEDYLVSNYGFEGKLYLGYKLTENGLIADMVFKTGSSIGVRNYFELAWGNDEKTEWKLDILFSEVAEEFEKSNAEVTNYSVQRCIFTGTEESVTYCESFCITPSKSLYYNLTADDVEKADYLLMDTKTHAFVFKDKEHVGETHNNYKDQNGNLVTIEGFTDEEIDSFLLKVQTYFKNSWTPKMMLKTFKESDCVSKTQEVITPINNQLFGA